MGRALGLRSEPYTAIDTADNNGEATPAGGGGGGEPLSPTIYQDDTGLSFEKDDDEDDFYDEEDNIPDEDDDNEGNNVATQPRDLQHRLDTTEHQTNERSFRIKFVLSLSFLAVLVLFGKEYYNNNNNGNGNGGNSKIISTEFTTEEYNGVRGKSESPLPVEETFDSTTSTTSNY